LKHLDDSNSPFKSHTHIGERFHRIPQHIIIDFSDEKFITPFKCTKEN
jgi:hypothetical protein